MCYKFVVFRTISSNSPCSIRREAIPEIENASSKRKGVPLLLLLVISPTSNKSCLRYENCRQVTKYNS